MDGTRRQSAFSIATTALRSFRISQRDVFRLQLGQLQGAEEGSNVFEGQILVSLIGAQLDVGLDVRKPPLFQKFPKSGLCRRHVCAAFLLGDQICEFALGLAFALGFEPLPLSLALACFRILSLKDSPPVAFTAFANVALHLIFPFVLSAEFKIIFGGGFCGPSISA